MKRIIKRLFYSEDRKKTVISVVVGAITGLINGLFGGGGGMIVVPLLIKVLKMKPRNAHATAILIILPISIISALFYSVFGNANLGVVLPVGLGVLGGGFVGAKLLGKISAELLFYIFYSLMLFAGVKMLI